MWPPCSQGALLHFTLWKLSEKSSRGVACDLSASRTLYVVLFAEILLDFPSHKWHTTCSTLTLISNSASPHLPSPPLPSSTGNLWVELAGIAYVGQLTGISMQYEWAKQHGGAWMEECHILRGAWINDRRRTVTRSLTAPCSERTGAGKATGF